MPEAETTAQQVGRLVLEQCSLEKQINKLRDDLSLRARTFARIGRLLVFHPERIVFEGQTVGEPFEGEAAIDRSAMDVDALLADLRAAIVRKKHVSDQLAEMGLDPEEAEQERNLRASRAIFHPANDGDGARRGPNNGAGIGFARTRKKT